MSKIILATLNARYIHSSFGLRYLLANLGSLEAQAEIQEFDINQRPIDICEVLLASNPQVIGFGVYIWNVTQTLEVLSLVKQVRPETVVVLGGPEVSYETAGQPIVDLADYVICGEADHAFRELCVKLFSGEGPPEKIIHATVPEVNTLAAPYYLYSSQDIAHRLVYVEASRGCPFTCEFCLSSLEIPVRQFALEKFLLEMQDLLKRGVRHFKFVDRTFNLNLQTSRAILEFFLERYSPDLFVHFEMVPDRLPEKLREIIVRFPRGALQFEVGIQTFHPEVGALISRRQNYEKLKENILFLKQESGVHIHADLIIGLPGETVESFGLGFNQLVALGPQEIQVGVLKRLRGTPIVRHDAEWQMVYSKEAPYEILKNRLIDFETMQRLKRFARYWDLVSNSGNFVETTPLLWVSSGDPFVSFLEFSDWLYRELGARHGIALHNLAHSLYRYLVEVQMQEIGQVSEALTQDYLRCGRKEGPDFLKTSTRGDLRVKLPQNPKVRTTLRQSRHLIN